VGDCYVAVAGLPDPRKDHAVVMARFANDCNLKLHRLVNDLEGTLAPILAILPCVLAFTVAPSLRACYEEQEPAFSSLVTLSTLRLVLKPLATRGAFISHRILPTYSLLAGSRSSKRRLWPRGKENYTLIGLIHVDVAQRINLLDESRK
jgi:hypothetical protein